MAEKYWEFTGRTRTEAGVELKQIRAAREFGDVAEGCSGGWIGDGVDLAQNGLAWVGKNARAFGGTIHGGTIHGGTIHGGTIHGGTIRGGTIRGGAIHGGAIHGGAIHGGAILGGDILGGDILGGTIHGGTIRGGTIRGGTIRGGTIRGGTIWGGDILGGDILGGDIHGGDILGGTIRGGTIRGGTIRGGAIRGGDFLTISPVGSENGEFGAWVTEDGIIICNRGCFTGSLDEFEAAVSETHAGSTFAREYALVITLVRSRLGPVAAERKYNSEKESA